MVLTTQNYGFMTCTSFSFVLAQLRELSRKIYRICSASSRILHGCLVRKFNCVSLKYMFQCNMFQSAETVLSVPVFPAWAFNWAIKQVKDKGYGTVPGTVATTWAGLAGPGPAGGWGAATPWGRRGPEQGQSRGRHV